MQSTKCLAARRFGLTEGISEFIDYHIVIFTGIFIAYGTECQNQLHDFP